MPRPERPAARHGGANQTIELTTEQITRGPQHHIFGYIGHAGTIPWNATGRYVLALRFASQDHMPGPGEAADVCLLDADDGHAVQPVDRSLAWNPQQGTMLYWNPERPATQFFFNDRDPESQRVFTVLYDIEARRRVREYRFEDRPVGNAGVAQGGGWFLALNYARMARLRRVTGYVGAWDWTGDVAHPADDGVHRVDVGTGRRVVIVSFDRLAQALRDEGVVDAVPPLFINHTLCNRDGDRVYFYARGGWDGHAGPKVNQPFTMAPDGRGLTVQRTFVGGHPEWAEGHVVIGSYGGRLVLYDTDAQAVCGQIGDPSAIANPGGDTALSADGTMTVTGYDVDGANVWVVVRRADGDWARTEPFDRGGYTRGDLRCDASPCWNRDGSQILFPSLTADGTRQLHLIHVRH